MVKNIKKVVPSFRYMSGKYKVRNKEKYVGDPNEIIFRSSYERKFMVFCDLDESVLRWSSEPYSIPYLDTVSEKKRNYFVDFYARIKVPDGHVQDYLVEVKPRKKLNKPLPPNRESLHKLKNYNSAMHEYLTNLSKFTAAKSYALKIGYKFIIVTEKELYGKS